MTVDWRWPDFSPDEMRCKCGCGQVAMDSGFMDQLQGLRDILRFPLPVTSGYRCPEHNAAVSNTGTSGPHTTGKAADIGVDRARAHTLLCVAPQMFSGIGVQQKGGGRRFIHLDTLIGPARPGVWSY